MECRSSIFVFHFFNWERREYRVENDDDEDDGRCVVGYDEWVGEYVRTKVSAIQFVARYVSRISAYFFLRARVGSVDT